jgi:hypothetical protein
MPRAPQAHAAMHVSWRASGHAVFVRVRAGRINRHQFVKRISTPVLMLVLLEVSLVSSPA